VQREAGRTLEAMLVPGHSGRVSSSQHVRGCPALEPVPVVGMVSRHGRGGESVEALLTEAIRGNERGICPTDIGPYR
jgi:hypothetical protein